MKNLSAKIKAMSVAGASALTMAVMLIKPLEGIEYKPYYDVAGVLTVCYGHTGSDIIKDKIYSQAECDVLLEKDLAKVKRQIDPIIKPALPESTKAALYSFTYNVGVGAFSRSTLLKKLNTGNIIGACGELKRWVYAGGKKWKGLMNRRQIEEEVCGLAFKSVQARLKLYIKQKDAGANVDAFEIYSTGNLSSFVYRDNLPIPG